MICFGIDVSKGKSTVCAKDSTDKIVLKIQDFEHTKSDMARLVEAMRKFGDEIRVVMETTGGYQKPILDYLVREGYWVTVVNAWLINKQMIEGIHESKTDKIDAKKLAGYGIEKWHKLKQYTPEEACYEQIRFCSRQYGQATEISTELKCQLDKLLDGMMPGISQYLQDDKLMCFVEKYTHFKNITEMGKDGFISDYCVWAKEKGYRDNERKSLKIWDLVQNSIPYVPNDEIFVKAILDKIGLIKETEKSRDSIITKIIEIIRDTPEFKILTKIKGVGEILAARFIAEIGDVRRFKNRGGLISYAGIDVPAYQSGKYRAKSGRISKRGNKRLRRVGYEIMLSIMRQKPAEDNAVYQFILKKEQEGKCKKAAKIAGLNKFLRIYYARIRQYYDTEANKKTTAEVTVTA